MPTEGMPLESDKMKIKENLIGQLQAKGLHVYKNI